MPLELIDGLVAKELHAFAALNEGLSFGREALELDGADLGAVLLFLAAPLRLLIVVELALDALRGAMEQIDGRPEESWRSGSMRVSPSETTRASKVSETETATVRAAGSGRDRVRPETGDSRRAAARRARDRSAMTRRLPRGRQH
jgi:hypothetical protein